MAKAIYVPVNGNSRKVNKMYVSVGGVSKKVVKGYCSVNGSSRLFWDDSGEKDYEEVYIDPSLDPSYLYIWQEPLYVHRGPFEIKRTNQGTFIDTVNIPSDGCVINNNLYKPDYIVEQLFVVFENNPSVTPQSVYYWFDRDTYGVTRHDKTYYFWLLQPRQYTWQDGIRESVRTSAGTSAYGQDAAWEAAYIIFGSNQ